MDKLLGILYIGHSRNIVIVPEDNGNKYRDKVWIRLIAIVEDKDVIVWAFFAQDPGYFWVEDEVSWREERDDNSVLIG